MTDRIPLLLIAMGLFWMASCRVDPVEPMQQNEFTYIFLGHIYQWHSPHELNRVDHRLETHDFGQYDGVLLGGDICSEATKFESTVAYIDNLFDLSRPSTHWSVGNHDVRNGNTHWIEERTQRPLYYTSSSNGLVWIVLNTSIDDIPGLADPCSMKADQIDMLYQALDTLENSQAVVILMHHVTWGNVESGMQTFEAANSNRPTYNFACDSVIRFNTHIYPKLVSLMDAGIAVTVLSGDGGQYKKSYAYQTVDGIEFFISGINNSVDTTQFMPMRPFNHEPDSVLLMHYNVPLATLDFEFIRLEELLN